MRRCWRPSRRLLRSSRASASERVGGGNGNLLVGKAYTALLDLKPGDEFEIKLGRKQIQLIPARGADDEE
jgi:hypothetical protein